MHLVSLTGDAGAQSDGPLALGHRIYRATRVLRITEVLIGRISQADHNALNVLRINIRQPPEWMRSVSRVGRFQSRGCHK
jgi:hypothetical protein